MRITDIFLAFPRPRAGACLRGGARPGHRQRGDRDLADRLAALCAARARRNRRHRQQRFHRRRRCCRARRPPASWLRHIVPLCLSSVIVRLTLDMAGIILTAAGLGFLGLGAQPPTPEWGAMVSAGSERDPRPVVGRNHPGLRHLHRQPRLQPPGRRVARRARPEVEMSAPPLLEVEGPRCLFHRRSCPLPGRARRVFHAGARAARHRRRIGLGQVDDWARPPRPLAAAGESECQAPSLRGHLDSAGLSARAWQRVARPPHVHGYAGPEILAQPRHEGGRADHRDPSPARRRRSGRSQTARARHAGGRADPRSRTRASISIRISSQAAWASA